MNNNIYSILHRLDSVTYNHSVRVMSIARELETFLSFDNHLLSNAALVHDVGKIYISSKILDKRGRLEQIERQIIDLHAYIGYQILKEQGIKEEICRIVLYHHGTDPILLDNIPACNGMLIYEMAQMLHSIDSFEALTSDRPYHRGLLPIEALEIMKKESGHHQATLDYLNFVLNNPDRDVAGAIFRGKNNKEDEFVKNVYYELNSVEDGMCKKFVRVI